MTGATLKLASFVAIAAFCTLRPSMSWAGDRHWSARYVSGSKKSQVGTAVDLLVSKDLVSCKKGKSIILQIPSASIAEVGYDNSSHNRGWTWLKASSDIAPKGKCSGDDAVCGAGTMLILTPIVVGAAVLAPFKSTQHFVRLFWDENGESNEALFEVGKDDYLAVLTALQDATGKPWRDLPAARKKLIDEIGAARDRRVAIQLDRNVVLNESEMKAGAYQLVVLERPDNTAEAYFFSGTEVTPDHVTAQGLARVGSSAPPAVNPSVTYADQMGAETIATVQVQDRKLEFVSAGLPRRVGQSFRSFYAGGDRWAVVVQAYFQGEPALRFRVLHNPFPHVCEEYIYVTHTRVASEITPDSSQRSCATFSAERGSIKAVAKEGRMINHFLDVTVGEKSYGFQPLFEGGGGLGRMAGFGRSRDAAREFAAFFVQAVTEFDAIELKSQPPPRETSEPPRLK